MRTLLPLFAAVSLLLAPVSSFACGGDMGMGEGYVWMTMRGRGMYVMKMSRREIVKHAIEHREMQLFGFRY